MSGIIPGKVVDMLVHDQFRALHMARTTDGLVWSKNPGSDWEQVDLISLALSGNQEMLDEAVRMASHESRHH